MFYHHDRAAIGTCKSCGKGLCCDCAVNMGKGLACLGKCKKNVIGLISPIEMTYSAAETEAIGLCISLEAVGDMANHELLELRGVSTDPGEVEVYFHTRIDQELFTIRLLDFVEENSDSKLTGVSGPCLKVLQAACVTGSFDQEGSIGTLKKSVKELDEWLNNKTLIKLWLPTLGIEADIGVSPRDLIIISGNHCKHNLSRLTRVSKNIHSILDSNGYSVPLEQIPLVLDDFREHLQEDYFNYYGTWLVELLNNIRWGIQNYLQPIFTSSYTKDDPNDMRYRYEYPEEIKQEIPRQWFWRLMDNIRIGPSLKSFSGSPYLKRKSSLERCINKRETPSNRINSD